MKTFLTLLLVFFTSFVFANEFWEVKFVRVIDGDTIEVSVDSLPRPINILHIRIKDIDTPEKGALAKCEKERILGLKATLAVKEIIGTSKTVNLSNMKHDKYGGRIVADVYVNKINVGQTLVQRGLATPYNGIGSKNDWCKN